MKDHKRETRNISRWDIDGLPVDLLIEKLTDASIDLVNPVFDIDVAEYYGDYELTFTVSGYRPMTDAEKEVAKEKAKKDRQQAKMRKEKAEREQEAKELQELLRLKKKFPDV